MVEDHESLAASLGYYRNQLSETLVGINKAKEMLCRDWGGELETISQVQQFTTLSTDQKEDIEIANLTYGIN